MNGWHKVIRSGVNTGVIPNTQQEEQLSSPRLRTGHHDKTEHHDIADSVVIRLKYSMCALIASPVVLPQTLHSAALRAIILNDGECLQPIRSFKNCLISLLWSP